MATLAADAVREYAGSDPENNDLPMIGSDIIYEGAAVGDNGSGLARPLVAADPFMGFAVEKRDNSAGAASAMKVLVHQKGRVKLAVVGAADADDFGVSVYASDDATFTLTSTSNTLIGVVSSWVSGTTCWVSFKGVGVA